MFYFYMVVAFVVYMFLGIGLVSFIEGMMDSDCSCPSFRFSFDCHDFWVYFLVVSLWPIGLFGLVFVILVVVLGKIFTISSKFLFYLTDKCIMFFSKHKLTGILGLYKFCYEMGYKFAQKLF